MSIPILPVGGKLRFAAGAPTALRSSTWTVIGGTNDRDVYIGTRASMSDAKFSLHASNRWRWAFTGQPDLSNSSGWTTSAFRSATEDPRVIARLPQPKLDQGWRRALDIVVSEPGLQHPFREKRVKGGAVSWWSPPEGEFIRVFAVFISEPGIDLEAVSIPDAFGVIQLPQDSYAVVATKIFHNPELVGFVRTERANFESMGFRQDGGYSPLLVRLNDQTTTVFDMGLAPEAPIQGGEGNPE